MNNKFVILIPSYNNSHWVEYNLASVLNQTYTNWKIIYINDASTDDTLQKVNSIIGNNNKCTIIDNEVNMGGTHNYLEHLDIVDDNDVVVFLDGDDWLIDEHVLEKLNSLYVKTDCWMTYGGMLVWHGDTTSVPNPQNTSYDDFVHMHKYYKRDTWRASHLRTYRGFLLKAVDKNSMRSIRNGKYYWHAGDLALQFACMEMCGKEKIGVVDFFTYVYNQHESIIQRTRQRESPENHIFETEIRNRKTYKTGLNAGKLPLINVIGDYRERNSIPTKFSYVYNQIYGEFDVTILQDYECIKYLNGDYGTLTGTVIADIYEPPYLFNQREVYNAVLNNADKFDYVFTYRKELLGLPNVVFRNAGHECVLNKNIHTFEPFTLANESLFGMYEKTKGISVITSNKTLTEFHIFRNMCVDFIRQNNLPVSIYGMGHNAIKGKIEGLKDYAYSIAIENGIDENYFTEKILDCFLTGTIPIYKGCPNIDEFFNPQGIIKFNSLEELKDIIDKINRRELNVPTEIKEENYKLALSYCYNNDRWFDKFIVPIINKSTKIML